MIAEKIRSARIALGMLAGKVDEEAWGLLRCVQNELSDAATQTEELERCLEVPQAPEASNPWMNKEC